MAGSQFAAAGSFVSIHRAVDLVVNLLFARRVELV
jgi:hypothetical protein